MSYALWSFASGCLEFLWSGNLVAASVNMEVTGRIDVASTASEMPKTGVPTHHGRVRSPECRMKPRPPVREERPAVPVLQPRADSRSLD